MIIIWIIGVIVLLILLINVYILADPRFGGKPVKNQMVKLARQSVYEKGKFRNPGNIPVILPKSYGKMLRLQFGDNPGRIPDAAIPSVKPEFKDDFGNEDLSLIWLGHSTVLIRIDTITILTDPVFSKRASPFSFVGPKSFEYSVPFTPENIPFPDIILISHDHFDHLDYRTIQNYYKGVKVFYVPLGVKSHLVRWGVPEENITELDWWSGKNYNDSLEFISTPAQHFTGRRGQNNSTLWCSWVIKGKKEILFFSGDSGYSNHFKEIGEKYGPFDIALMECGAYGTYWPYIHMVPEESVQAGLDVKAHTVIPIHWGKYNLAFHPWKEPVERFIQEASVQKLSYITPKPGEQVVIGSKQPTHTWWK